MKTKKVILLFSFILSLNVSSIRAQVIKIENGISLSSLRMKGYKDGSFETIRPYQFSLGVDYCQRKWFHLSSNVGYLVRGRNLPMVTDGTNSYIHEERFKYITANSLFNVNYIAAASNTVFYLGVGPRVDFNISSTNNSHKHGDGKDIWEEPAISKTIYGMKSVVGMKALLNDVFEVGLNFAYLPSFNDTFKDSTLRDRTFTLGVSLGYKIR